MMLKFFTIGQFQAFCNYARKKYPDIKKYELVSNVKIHGTHIDVILFLETKEIQIQSRNNVLSRETDMYGVVTWILERESTIRRIFENIKFNTPHANKMIRFACEFAGSNIQKGIALNQVPKFLVIYGLQVDFVWIPQEDWSHLQLHSVNDSIFTIQDERLKNHIFQLDIIDTSRTRNELVNIVEEIDKQCPFASAIFNVKGVGEGLVLHAKGYENDTQMYFKVKGPSHCENKIKILRAQSEEMIEKHKTIHGFVDAILTPRRLEQGYEFLLEQQLDHKEIKNIGTFVKWLLGDVRKECSDDMEEMNAKLVYKEVSHRAQQHYKAHLKSLH